MFRRLVTADLVVADVSIHNANVFYELGIRHALRDRSTFMLRCRADAFPFDLQTDRYLEYNKDDPAARLEDLVASLRRTLDSGRKDSPVFMWLPNLREPDPSEFMVVPPDFGEEVKRAADSHCTGDLALLSYEVKGYEWELRGWRTIGKTQFDLKAFAAAKVTWEHVRRIEPNDLDANLLLGTIYERLGDLTRSTQALERALANRKISPNQRAEAYSLLARNAKSSWRDEWEGVPSAERATAALRSRFLRDAFENYARAFDEDLNHFYSGLNALAMLEVMLALAEAHTDVWADQFDTDKRAEEVLEDYRERAKRLAAAVELSLNATITRLKREARRTCGPRSATPISSSSRPKGRAASPPPTITHWPARPTLWVTRYANSWRSTETWACSTPISRRCLRSRASRRRSLSPATNRRPRHASVCSSLQAI
jgi:tetratricopeptide (TPR) repeat protein